MTHKRASKRHLLPLSDREFVPLLKHAPQSRIVLLRKILYNRSSPALRGSLPYEFIIVKFLDISESDILPCGHFIMHKILENDADMPANIQCIVFFQWHTIEQYLTCRWLVEVRQQFYQSRFPRAIVTYERDTFSCF